MKKGFKTPSFRTPVTKTPKAPSFHTPATKTSKTPVFSNWRNRSGDGRRRGCAGFIGSIVFIFICLACLALLALGYYLVSQGIITIPGVSF